MLGAATGKTAGLAHGREFHPGPGASRGSLLWAHPSRGSPCGGKVQILAQVSCFSLHPGPHQDPGTVSTTSHTSPGSSGSTEVSLGRQPNALFLSSLSWKSCLFSVSPPPRLPVTVSVPAVWLPAAHTPGTSLVKVTVPSVPLTGFTVSPGLPAALEKADHFPSHAFFQPGSQGCALA